MLYIHNATIYTPQEIVERGALLVDGQRIIACAPAGQVSVPAEAEMLDAGGALVVPGFIALPLNGAFGDDFSVSAESL
jgi:N-acetylglucosamine-6-phosphate deacetylase